MVLNHLHCVCICLFSPGRFKKLNTKVLKCKLGFRNSYLCTVEKKADACSTMKERMSLHISLNLAPNKKPFYKLCLITGYFLFNV